MDAPKPRGLLAGRPRRERVSRYLDVLTPPLGSQGLLSPAGITERLRALAAAGAHVEQIGRSRDGNPLEAIRVGDGPFCITAIAGAHSDEPVGAITLLHLAEALQTNPKLAKLKSQITLHALPMANPDGSIKNQRWLAAWTESNDLGAYFSYVRRDSFDRDVEYGFSRSGYGPQENKAIAAWFDRIGRIDHYASLHSMFLSGGALFLVNAADRSRFGRRLLFLLDESRQQGLTLHDKDRGGEKGFDRICAGLQTAPTSQSMGGMNSMEYVRNYNKCPLALVTEMPLAYDPEISSMKLTPRTRDQVEDEFARGLRESRKVGDSYAARLSKLRLSKEGQESLEHLRRLLGKDFSSWKRFPGMMATEGNVRDTQLNLHRRTAGYFAVALAALEGCKDPAGVELGQEIARRLEAELDRFKNDYGLTHPPLEVQMRLQMAALLSGLVPEVDAPSSPKR